MTGSRDVIVTPAIAIAWLWYFGKPEGREPGHFTSALLEAISHADETNLAQLRLGFPDHVDAYLAGSREVGGIDRLVSIASTE